MSLKSIQRAQDLRVGQKFTFLQNYDRTHCRNNTGVTEGQITVLEWPHPEIIKHNRTSLMGRENDSGDRIRREGEYSQIQVCQACGIILKKPGGCNRCQRCFNYILRRKSEFLCWQINFPLFKYPAYFFNINNVKASEYFPTGMWVN